MRIIKIKQGDKVKRNRNSNTKFKYGYFGLSQIPNRKPKLVITSFQVANQKIATKPNYSGEIHTVSEYINQMLPLTQQT